MFLISIIAGAAPAFAFLKILGKEAGAFGGGSLPSRAPINIDTRLASTKSYVELFDRKTNTEVVLLGCLHGSLSSSIDVRQILLGEEEQEAELSNLSPKRQLLPPKKQEQKQLPDAVVLELCDDRFRGIESSKDSIVENYSKVEFWEDVGIFWTDVVWPTGKEQGPVVALAKLLLGSTSLLQTNLSGIRAGLEFEVAMDIVNEHNIKQKRDGNNINARPIDIVLGDRNFEKTMERIGDLPSVSLEIVLDGNPFESIPRANKLLFDAILGDPALPKGTQTCMPRALMRNPQARADLGRLLVLPGAVAAVTGLVLAWTLRGFELDPYDVMLFESLWIEGIDSGGVLLDLLLNSSLDVAVFVAGYVFVALPASKVIVSERDQILAEAILTGAVRAADRVQEDEDASRPRGKKQGEYPIGRQQAEPIKRRVVAILGLLHVNGVARELLDRGFGCASKNEPKESEP